MNSIRSVLLLGLLSVFLTNCSLNRSHLGAFSGGATGVTACVTAGATDPYVTGACAITGAFAGAELMYNSDYDVHNAVFVDHLNTSGNGSSYTNWYNKKTKNFGIIRVTNTYTEGPLVCKEYDETVNIKKSFPFLGYGSSAPHREVRFGKVCQLPDGRWFEHE